MSPACWGFILSPWLSPRLYLRDYAKRSLAASAINRKIALLQGEDSLDLFTHSRTSVRQLLQLSMGISRAKRPSLSLAQMDRTIAGVDGHQIAAAVPLSPNFVLADCALRCDRHIDIDVSVPGVQVDVRGHVCRNLQRDVAVAGFEPPA